MRRDWDTIRKILIETEELAPGHRLFPSQKRTVQTDDEIVTVEKAEHMYLLWSNGFVEGACVRDLNGGLHIWTNRLTWKGHELIDSIRDEGVWRRVQGKLSEVSGAVTLAVLCDLAAHAAREVLALK
jgi:hypothetical protein